MNLLQTAADLAARLSALIVFRAGPGSMPVYWRMILGALAALAAFSATPLSDPITAPKPATGHGEVGLQIALADAYCGLRNRTFPVNDMFENLTPAAAATPLDRFIPERLGVDDLKIACARAEPYPDFHEFTASALVKGAIALPPEDTPLTLMAKMRALIVIAVVCASALLAFLRLGPLAIFMIAEATFVVTAPLEAAAWSEYYYYMPAAALAIVALSAMLGKALVESPFAIAIAAAAMTGAAFALIENLRTTYGLAFAGVLASITLCAAILKILRARGHRPRAAAGLFAAGLAFAMSATAADRIAFTSFRATDAAPELEYHLFWHPLVLGLALPGTAFTRAEGIEWNDSVGVDLARRINPDSPTYGLVYEDALKTYYLGLWRDHPSEMIGAYLAKVGEFGGEQASILQTLGYAGPFAMLGLRGFPLVIALLVALAVVIWMFLKRGRVDFAFLAVSTTALFGLLGLEYVIVLTEFSPTHNAAGLIPFILFDCSLLAAVVVGFRDQGLKRANEA